MALSPVECRRNKVGNLSRYKPNSPELAQARAELAEAKLAAYITRTVATAPPLSAEQRNRLALLLRPAS